MAIEQKLSLESATIGILTVLAEEFIAAVEVLGCFEEASVDGRIYRIGAVQRRDNSGAHVVAVTRLTDMGTNAAAVRASSFRHDCPNLAEIVVCGIAGAVPNPKVASDHVRLGDIVVVNAEGTIQYDFVKESEAQSITRARPRPPSPRLLETARLLEAEEQAGKRPWDLHIHQAITALSTTPLGARWRRPLADTDQLREFSGTTRDYCARAARWLGIRSSVTNYSTIAHPTDSSRLPDLPRVFHGAIASANNLQKNRQHRDELRDTHRVRAVEMEGSGVAEAAYQMGIPYFVVRGTCDYCNADKNDSWHHYASIAAAGYLRALLEAAPASRYITPSSSTTRGTQLIVSRTVALQPTLESDDSMLLNRAQDAMREGLELALGALVKDEAQERLLALKGAIDAWEFDSAVRTASELSSWLELNEQAVDKLLLVQICQQLLRTEFHKAQQQTVRGLEPDISAIDHLIRKARRALE